MQSKEFIIWLKGFITACNDYAPTPKQWDIIKEELEKVSDEQKSIGVPIGPGWGIPNTAPTPIQPYIDPFNPYKITCSVTGSSGTTIHPTPGTTGFITIANPYIASFGSGSSYTPAFSGSGDLWKASTSTTYAYPSGSLWHYTNNGSYNKKYINPYKPFSTMDNDSLKPKHTKKKAKTVNDWEEEFDLGGGE